MFDFTYSTLLYAVALLLLILLSIEGGRRLGRFRLKQGDTSEGTGSVEAALFAVLGLLLAFTFSGAATRFDDRRELIVTETNAIGTAYLRVDLLPPEAQPAIRQKLREYLDARIAFYEKLDDREDAVAERDRYTRLQNEIWSASVAASRGSEWTPGAMLMLPALNEMIDITTTRQAAMGMHPPRIIFVMLILLSLVAGLLAGISSARSPLRAWVHITAFALTLAVTFYVIVDLEFPRQGLIRVDKFDKVMIDLRESMK